MALGTESFISLIHTLWELPSEHEEEPCDCYDCPKQGLWIPVFDRSCHRAALCTDHRRVMESYDLIKCMGCGLYGLKLVGWERL